MAIYLKLDNIKGNVTTEGYQQWIDCIDLSFDGIHSDVQQHIGHDMDRVISHPFFGDIHLIKFLDQSSIALFEHAHNRKAIEHVDIHCVNTSDPIFTFAKYTLKNVIVSHYSEMTVQQLYAKPREFISLSYTALEKTYIPKDSDNKPQSPIISGYDLAQGEAM